MPAIVSGLTTTAPVTLACDRFGNMYGVNGVTRGWRYSGGTSAVTMGVTTGAVISASPVIPPTYYVSDVVVTDPGENYSSPPTVTISGVSSPRATLSGGAVDSVVFPWSATTHAAAPFVTLSGGQENGGGIVLTNTGGVAGVDVDWNTVAYTAAPEVTFFANTAAGSVIQHRPAQGRCVLRRPSYSGLASIIITDPGSYTVMPGFTPGASPVGATVPAGSYTASSAKLQVRFSGIVSAATVTAAGSKYTSPPRVNVLSNGPLRAGGGALVACSVSAGSMTSATVTQPGSGYDGAVSAELSSQPVTAVATMKPLLQGKYLCAIRYADSTPASRGGPNYGSTSQLVEVDCGDGAAGILWTKLPQTSPDPQRITHVELWRTTGDQAITLYRVARYAFGSVPTEYMDSMPDDQLSTGVSFRTIQAVTSLAVTDTGSGYSSAPSVTISGGGGSGATATAQISKFVSSVTVSVKGSGYTTAPAVAFSGGGGAGAAATATLEYTISSIAITNGGSGYTTAPDVLLDGQSGPWFSTVSGGSVISVSLFSTFVKSNNTPPTVTFSGGGGTGATATATPSGRVASVTVTAGGSGYTSPPTLAFSGGGGSGAVASANVDMGVTGLSLTSQGSGFTGTPTVSFSGGGGTGATGSATVSTVAIPTTSEVYSLPIITEEGYPSSERFGIPPADMAVLCFCNDRAWYAVSDSRPNTICFSEIDEPESVPDAYELNLQQPPTGADSITGLFVMSGTLYAAQTRNICRLVVTGHPLEATTAAYVAQRGMLNQRCCDIYDGIAYIADGYGVYAFDGAQASPLSDAVGNFWTDPRIDFAASKWFSLQVDPQDKVVRFYYKQVGDSGDLPKRALCYSLVTKAWWTESYATPIGTAITAGHSSQQKLLLGTSLQSVASLALPSGTTDDGTSIPYAIKTGNYPLNSEPKRGVRLTYTPTAATHQLGVACYFNGSTDARQNAVSVNVGAGVVSTQGSTVAAIDLSTSRSALAQSNGFAKFTMAGRIDDRSAGGDRDIAIELSGTQSTSRVIVHRLEIEGAG